MEEPEVIFKIEVRALRRGVSCIEGDLVYNVHRDGNVKVLSVGLRAVAVGQKIPLRTASV